MESKQPGKGKNLMTKEKNSWNKIEEYRKRNYKNMKVKYECQKEFNKEFRYID